MKSTAWENLFKRYYNEALLYVYSFCRNRALAEDVVQEAYMRAIRSINEEKDGFKFWLFKVCRNYNFDTLRKNKRLESISDDKKKVTVSASLFGRETKVELDVTQVKTLDE